MARNGKIARMSLDIRNELNRRLQDGESGTTLLKWLNRQAGVRQVLAEQFGGKPISEQNLSEWRQGGYKDWLRLEAARDFIDNMSEQSGELDEAAGGELISDRFGSVLAAEMAQVAMKFLEQEEDLEKRWNRLKEINREFSRMRRDDHRGLRTGIKRAQWERQQEQDKEEADEKMRRRERVAALFDTLKGPTPAKPRAEGPSGRGPSRTGHHLKEEAPSGGAPGPKAEGRRQKEKVSEGAAQPASSKTRKSEPQDGGQSIQPNQSKSDRPLQGYGATSQIKPNQTNSDLKQDEAGIAIKVEGSGFRVDKKEEPDIDDSAEKTACPTSSG